ncbi:MAG: hypothetical protein G01um10145_822 [Microgenomates group bacterium Gr01-1014_5]|nr:MAG: hypothetical protein G01um10145_822 [Microgenomates group bacterium Gr01-1014_5]
MLVFSNMLRAERNFVVPEELATSVYRGIHTGSGVGRSWERELREALKEHLGLGLTATTSPEYTVIGVLLISYITSSTHLIGMLEGRNPEVVQTQVREYLQFNPLETPQETVERLLNIAIDNSQRINSR